MSETAKFTWIPFYEEFALKLLEFVDDRSELVKKIKEINPERIHFITAKTPDGDFHDIDPFSVFAIFNRSSNTEKRQEILNAIKKSFSLESDVPEDFDAIPLVNAKKACFYYEDEKSETIPLLWNLFKVFMENKIDDIKDLFDKAQKRKGIRWNLTMAFFWMKPKEYMPLDAKSRNFIQNHLAIKLFNESRLNGENYLSCIKRIKDASNQDFAVLSNEAWLLNEKMEVNGLMAQDNSSNWPDELIDDMDGDVRPGAFWWHENPVGKDDTIKLLRDKLKEDGSFDFYIFRNRKAVYRAVVTDFVCSQEEYSQKIDDWKKENTQWLKNSFAEFNDSNGKRTAKILFHVDEMEKLENPISMGDFDTSRDYKRPHITKLVPFKRVNAAGNSHSEDEEMDISTYVKLLEANHNIILHGAPGTGKTYLAKKIAEEMNAEYEMVQFHQSYDYTDFVEGLRPVDKNGSVVFERKNGVFKDFCKKALLASQNKNSNEISFAQAYEDTLKKIEQEEIQSFSQKSGVEVYVKEISSQRNIVLQSFDTISKDVNDQARKHTVSFNRLSKLFEKFSTCESLKNIVNIDKEISNVIGGCNASAYWAVLYSILNYKESYKNSIESVNKKFIFIIDEINRGEMSKIFGELFFSVDPGYRGFDGKVKTQYQALVPSSDVFIDGFFVPENVYIIGTMNDIDRSVESMDFAMRRRFAFKEISAEDSMPMLDNPESWKNAKGESVDVRSELAHIKNRMLNLNDEILKEEFNLGSSYQIGAAYFLKFAKYFDGANATSAFNDLWDYHLEGVLREYLRGMSDVDGLLEKLKTAYDVQDYVLKEKKSESTEG